MEKILVEKEFADYVTNSRNEFVRKFWLMCPEAKQRVIAEDLLIAYDQITERFKTLKVKEWHCTGCDKIVPNEQVFKYETPNVHSVILGGCGYKVVPVE